MSSPDIKGLYMVPKTFRLMAFARVLCRVKDAACWYYTHVWFAVQK